MAEPKEAAPKPKFKATRDFTDSRGAVYRKGEGIVKFDDPEDEAKQKKLGAIEDWKDEPPAPKPA